MYHVCAESRTDGASVVTRRDADRAKWIPKRVQDLAKSWTGADGFMYFVGLHHSTRKDKFYKGPATYRCLFFWDSMPVRTRRVFTKDLQHIVSTHARLFPLAAPVIAPVGIPYVFACPSCLDNKKCFQLRLRMRCLEFLFQLRLRMRCPVLVPLFLPILPLLVSRSFTTLSCTPGID